MSHYGDYVAGSIIYILDTSEVNFVPTDFAGSQAVSVYKDDGAGESTAGVTFTVPFDTKAGLWCLKIDTSADGSFYATGHTFHAVLTTGTLGAISQVGLVLGSFTLGRGNIATYAGDTPQTGDSYAVIKSGGANLDKSLIAVPRGTATSGASTTSIPTSALSIAGSAATGVVANQFAGRVVLFDGATTTAGLRGASSTISANTASNTPTLTVGALPATPASGDLFSII